MLSGPTNSPAGPGPVRAAEKGASTRIGLAGLMPAEAGPGPFVEIIEHNLRRHLRNGDRAGKLCASCKDEAQYEGVHAPGDPPADCLRDGPRMRIPCANRHRSLQRQK